MSKPIDLRKRYLGDRPRVLAVIHAASGDCIDVHAVADRLGFSLDQAGFDRAYHALLCLCHENVLVNNHATWGLGSFTIVDRLTTRERQLHGLPPLRSTTKYDPRYCSTKRLHALEHLRPAPPAALTPEEDERRSWLDGRFRGIDRRPRGKRRRKLVSALTRGLNAQAREWQRQTDRHHATKKAT
jgi:hypothetical protein